VNLPVEALESRHFEA